MEAFTQAARERAFITLNEDGDRIRVPKAASPELREMILGEREHVLAVLRGEVAFVAMLVVEPGGDHVERMEYPCTLNEAFESFPDADFIAPDAAAGEFVPGEPGARLVYCAAARRMVRTDVPPEWRGRPYSEWPDALLASLELF